MNRVKPNRMVKMARGIMSNRARMDIVSVGGMKHLKGKCVCAMGQRCQLL